MCALPSEAENVLARLDVRLFPAFSLLCARDPSLCHRYPEVASVAESMTKKMPDLCLLAGALGVDVSGCEKKEEVVQALLASGKVVAQAPATSCSNPVPSVVDRPPASGRKKDASTNRAALMALYNATGGDAWQQSSHWGTDAPLKDWHGVEVNGQGRVVLLKLRQNDMVGELPPAFFELSAPTQLYLEQNEICGSSLVPDVGNLRNLERLDLSTNSLCGVLPKEIEHLKKLTLLNFQHDNCSGSIPKEIGCLQCLQDVRIRYDPQLHSF